MPESIDDTDAIPEYAPLTRKQNAFVDAILNSGYEHGSIIAAYRSAYNWDGLDNGASVEAWRLLNNPKITRRLQDAANAQGATRDRIVSGILARTEDDTTPASVALNGYELLAKISGLLNPAPTATSSVTNNVVAVGSHALAEILSMLDAPPSVDTPAKVIDGKSAT